MTDTGGQVMLSRPHNPPDLCNNARPPRLGVVRGERMAGP